MLNNFLLDYGRKFSLGFDFFAKIWNPLILIIIFPDFNLYLVQIWLFSSYVNHLVIGCIYAFLCASFCKLLYSLNEFFVRFSDQGFIMGSCIEYLARSLLLVCLWSQHNHLWFYKYSNLESIVYPLAKEILYKNWIDNIKVTLQSRYQWIQKRWRMSDESG